MTKRLREATMFCQRIQHDGAHARLRYFYHAENVVRIAAGPTADVVCVIVRERLPGGNPGGWHAFWDERRGTFMFVYPEVEQVNMFFPDHGDAIRSEKGSGRGSILPVEIVFRNGVIKGEEHGEHEEASRPLS